MRLQAEYTCDVLVVGTGLAGIRAAISAAEEGRSVLLCTAGKLFSGSSFYPGTWGLGLVGPDGAEDEEDLIDSICTLGAGMADDKLVRSFVRGINPAVAEIKAMGIRLKQAHNKDQKDFIPCFDRKHRNWNGILFDSARTVFSQRLEELNMRVLEHCEALELTKHEGRVTGAVMALEGKIRWIRAGSVALCGGGLGGLYRYRLTTDDVLSSCHALALRAGAELTNLEFMQIMPGFVTPCPKTIFNEKTFRYLRMEGVDPGVELMELRSTHGPFTSRLADRAVDLQILRRQGNDGLACRYMAALSEDTPEFITTYFDWLRATHGVTMQDPFRIALYAHAANGGIRIDETGFTGIPGLYAAGECTGGMHGADRIGGLSTANGLVFGSRAGHAAAERAAADSREWGESEPVTIPDVQARREKMQHLMTRHALVERTAEGLEFAMSEMESLSALGTGGDPLESQRLANQLLTARAVLTAQQMRRESRGSHYRADHPGEDPAMVAPIRITLNQDSLRVVFAKKEE